MKVAINVCHGGFSLSAEAVLRLIEMRSPLVSEEDLADWRDNYGASWSILFDDVLVKGDKVYIVNVDCENRAHPDLIAVIEEMGEKANGVCAKLRIVDVPDDVEWEIAEYYGWEHVAEKHRTWS